MKTYAIEYADFFRKLSKDDKEESYKKFFDENSMFEDPFQKVYGLNAIYKVFENMYETHVTNIRSKILRSLNF